MAEYDVELKIYNQFRKEGDFNSTDYKSVDLKVKQKEDETFKVHWFFEDSEVFFELENLNRLYPPFEISKFKNCLKNKTQSINVKFNDLFINYYSLIYTKNTSGELTDILYKNNKFNFTIIIKKDVLYYFADIIFNLMNIYRLNTSKLINSFKYKFENFNVAYNLNIDLNYNPLGFETFSFTQFLFPLNKENDETKREDRDMLKNKNNQGNDITYLSIYYDIEFIDCIFQIINNQIKLGVNTLISYRIEFSENVSFINCHFDILKDEKNVESTIETKTKIDFSCFIFKKDVSFINSTFYQKTLFIGTIFMGNTKFHNTRFLKLVDFFDVEFPKCIIFYKIDFLEKSVFAKTKFHQNVLFTYSTIKTMILRQTVFEKGFDFSLCSSIESLQIFNIKYNDNNYLAESINESEYENSVTIKGDIPLINKKETYRIFKHHLEKVGDHTAALDFKSLEMKTYTKIIFSKWNKFNKWNKFKNWDKIKKLIKLINETLILLLNKWSNNFESSWILGVIFTLGCGILFYYLTLLSTSKYTFYFSIPNIDLDEIKNFIDFMNPLHNPNNLEIFNIKNEKEFAPYIWDFIGRIFVGYGIYQTIQAFRKFKSK